MAQSSGFWHWYAQANDDIRFHLIERSWFGRHVPDHAMQSDVENMAGQREAQSADAKSRMEAFYGVQQPANGSTTQEQERGIREFYGHER